MSAIKNKNVPLSFLRSTIWWVGYAVSTIISGIVFLPTALLPFKPRYRLVGSWSRFNIWTLKWICGVNYVIEGKENIPQHAAIVMSKHQSSWETLALSFIFPPQAWVLKQTLLKIPFFGWGLALLEPIAIDRSAGTSALEQVIEQGRERLDNDVWVVIYPEGTRTPAGTKRRYKQGGSVLATATGYPVVPVAHNAGLLWPREQFNKWPGTVTVRIGPPIESKSKTAEQLNKEVEDWIETQQQELNNL